MQLNTIQRKKTRGGLEAAVMPQLWVQVIQMSPYTPLWKRGAGGDFISIILKSPFIPLCPPGQRPLWVGDQRGIKTPVTEKV